MTASPALLASIRRHPGPSCLALVVGVWGCLGWVSWARAAPPAAARQPSAAPAGPAKDDPAIAKRAFDTLMRANEAADALKAAERQAAERRAARDYAAEQRAAAEQAVGQATAELDAARSALAKATADKPRLEKAVTAKTEALRKAERKLADAIAAAKAAEEAYRTAADAERKAEAAYRAAAADAAVARAAALGGLPPLPADEWDYAKARHLLVRAGFGGTPDEVQQLYAMGLHRAVDYLVEIYDRPLCNLEFEALREQRYEPWMGRLAEPDRFELNNLFRRRERYQQGDLRQWWLRRMAESPRPLQEKLTLFWHDHFAVQYRELNSTRMVYTQNQLFRTYGCDNFGALLHGIVLDPAMIRYLDNHQNRKSSGNENLGRELQELFSLGEEHSGNHRPGGYTEEDVREVARALTGYTYDPATQQFRFLGSQHDSTNKRILGRTGPWSGNEAVDILLRHPATAEYVSKKLFIFFAHEQPTPEVIGPLAHVLRSCNYEMRPLLKNLFLSAEFYSPQSMSSHIKSPVELVVGAIRDLGLTDVNYAAVDSATSQMGQTLFEPPNVAGWDENRAWVNAERLLVRYNQMAGLVERPTVDVVTLLEGTGADTPQEIVDFLARACLVRAPSEPKRQELVAFLGELPPAEQWEAQRQQLNTRLRALLAMLMSIPESQLG